MASRKQKLDATIEAAKDPALSTYLHAHYARYICVLVSGHAEQSIKELLLHHARITSHTRITKYVGAQLKRFQNVDLEKFKQLIESFDRDWWETLAAKYPDELTAFTSIAASRNQIAHGGNAGITMGTVAGYYRDICTVLDSLADILDPPAGRAAP